MSFDAKLDHYFYDPGGFCYKPVLDKMAPKCAPAKKTKLTKHVAQVVRFRLEAAIVEFRADPHDHEGAEKKAAAVSARLLDEALQDFDDEMYQPHTGRFVSKRDLDHDIAAGGESTSLEEVDEVVFVDPHCLRFLILAGVINTGEGEVLWQPWFKTDPPELVHSDIGSDWLRELGGRGIQFMLFPETLYRARRQWELPSGLVVSTVHRGGRCRGTLI